MCQYAKTTILNKTMLVIYSNTIYSKTTSSI